jgi:hypothetical protein
VEREVTSPLESTGTEHDEDVPIHTRERTNMTTPRERREKEAKKSPSPYIWLVVILGFTLIVVGVLSLR